MCLLSFLEQLQSFVGGACLLPAGSVTWSQVAEIHRLQFASQVRGTQDRHDKKHKHDKKDKHHKKHKRDKKAKHRRTPSPAPRRVRARQV